MTGRDRRRLVPFPPDKTALVVAAPAGSGARPTTSVLKIVEENRVNVESTLVFNLLIFIYFAVYFRYSLPLSRLNTNLIFFYCL